MRGPNLLVTRYSYIWEVWGWGWWGFKFLWEWVQFGFISVTRHFVTCDNGGVDGNLALLLNVRGGS